MQKNYSIHFLKFFAIMFVVSAHTKPFIDLSIGSFESKYIFYAFNAFARATIPFFFIISGYLLGEKLAFSRAPFKLFKRYFLSIAKMFLIWAIFYQIYNIAVKMVELTISGQPIKKGLITFIFAHFPFNLTEFYYGPSTSTTYHLWYLTAVIWSLVILYFFIKINKVGFLLIGSFVLNLIGVFGQSYSVLLDIGVRTVDALFFGLFYVTLGYYLSRNPIDKKLRIKSETLLMLFFFFSLLQIMEAAVMIVFFKGYLGEYYISTIPATLCLILFALKNRQLGKDSIFIKISKRTELIYVIHPFIISLVYLSLKYLDLESVRSTVLWNILFTPFVFLTSYYTHQPLKKMKMSIRLKKTKENKEISSRSVI